MTMNPADDAAENYKNEMDKSRAEVSKSTPKNGNQSKKNLKFTLPIS